MTNRVFDLLAGHAGLGPSFIAGQHQSSEKRDQHRPTRTTSAAAERSVSPQHPFHPYVPYIHFQRDSEDCNTLNASHEPAHAHKRSRVSVIAIVSLSGGDGPSPMSTGLSADSTAGTPWLPRTSAGVERDHIEQGAKSQLLLCELHGRPALRPESLRVEEQLARVVTGLAVDVDGAREIGGQADHRASTDTQTTSQTATRPPDRRLADGPDQSRARLAPAYNARDAGQSRRSSSPHALPKSAMPLRYVDVRDLVIADGECPAAERVEHLAERPGTHSEQPGLSQSTRFNMHRCRRHVAMTVLTDDPDPADLAAAVSRITAHASSSSRTRRAMIAAGWPEALRIVIQVRKIHQARARARVSG